MSTLYKYVANPSVAENFLEGSIKFSPIRELNDPSELTSNVIYEKVVQSLRRLRRDGYDEDDLLHLRRQEAVLRALAPEFQAVGAPASVEDANRLIRSPFYDQTQELDRLLQQTTEVISRKVGVFCLSKRADSLPMWAHYGGNATGFVVELNGLDEVFRGDETGVLWVPTEVRYQRDTGGVTFEPRSHDAIFFEKFSDWSYEQEVRVIAPLDSCKQVPTNPGILYLYDLPKHVIVRLILGWNIDEDVARRIEESAANSSRVQVVRAKIDQGRVITEAQDR